MAEPRVTIIIGPRDHFSAARRSLESIVAHTSIPYRLVYVDGRSPAPLERWLNEQSAKHGFELVRSERYITPNEAHNIGLSKATTEYVCFVDNDVLVTAGWLERLLACADETKAWVVGPLTLMGPLESELIHIAGGETEIRTTDGNRRLHQRQRWENRRVSEVPLPTTHERTGLVEFHCMLVRREVFDRLGPFDEGLLNTRDHLDFSLLVTQAGGTIYFEPRSLCTFLTPTDLEWSDIPYYLLRWSDTWTRASVDHFERKWEINLDAERRTIIGNRRLLALRPLLSLLARATGYRVSRAIEQSLVIPIERQANRAFVWFAGHRRPSLRSERAVS